MIARSFWMLIAITLIERARLFPAWSNIQVNGVITVPPRDDKPGIAYGPTDDQVRHHGVSTPTLLLEIAEGVMAGKGAKNVRVLI